MPMPALVTEMTEINNDLKGDNKLWSSSDSKKYFPVSNTYNTLPPDVYEPHILEGGVFFERLNFNTESLIQFEDSSIDKVITEISSFWNHKERFKEFGFPYKRGILLWGPPGSGKSCAIKLIIEKVIMLGGVGVRFDDPWAFIYGMRALRQIEPETPVVVIMEDLDAIMTANPESLILNTLDGIDGFENIVYLATTNYPEELEGRIKNRPSRFDRRFHIGFPNEKSRMIYIKHLQDKIKDSKIDINRWVKDTEKFTLAHIKELFISVVLFEHSYEDALSDLIEMRKKIKSQDDDGKAGFQ